MTPPRKPAVPKVLWVVLSCTAGEEPMPLEVYETRDNAVAAANRLRRTYVQAYKVQRYEVSR